MQVKLIYGFINRFFFKLCMDNICVIYIASCDEKYTIDRQEKCVN